MKAVTIQPGWLPVSVLRPARPGVYVDGQRRRNLEAVAWSVLPAPDFGKATVALAMSSRHGGQCRIEDVTALPAVGSRMQVCLFKPVRQVVFDGYVTRHHAAVEPDREQLTADADDGLKVLLSAPVVGRWQATSGLTAFLPGATLVFNDEQEGRASPDLHLLNGRTCRIFQPAPSGQPWSVADVVKYLLAAHVQKDISAEWLGDAENVAGQIFPTRFSLTGLAVSEAIARTVALAGLSARGSIGGEGEFISRGLVFYRPGRAGRRRTVALQRHGEALDIRRSNLLEARIRFHSRPGRQGAVALGGLKRYESTFLLQAGWDRQLETYHYRDFVRGEAADWPAVADVFRKWVLNEAGHYCGPPWNLPRYDLAAISGEDFLAASPRRFERCLSLDKAGRSMGVVVEVSTDGGSTWRRYPGPVRVSANECAVYLADDALGADYFQAALAAGAKVRVTATVTSDRRLSAAVTGDPGCPVRVMLLPSAHWAMVHPASIFHGRSDLPAPAERDDSARLLQLAAGQSQSEATTVEAELALAWMDPTWNVGDVVEQVQGRQLNLAALPGSRPCVRAVEHHADERWSTLLTVSG